MKVWVLFSALLLSACSQTTLAPDSVVKDSIVPVPGSIVDLRSGKTITSEELLEQLAAAPQVIVGEKHDNANHHKIEQWLVENLARQRPQGSVLMEMLTPNQQEKVNKSKLWLQNHPDAKASEIAEQLDWKKSWDWSMYNGVVMAAMKGRYPLLSANLNRDEILALYKNPVFPAGSYSSQPDVRAAIAETIRVSHDGKIEPEQQKSMLAIQQHRDRRMAESLLAAPTPALLIVGGYHASKKLGVPLHIRDLDSQTTPLVLMLAEQGSVVTAESADFVWTTP
ncbi:ChaN family lipoprotein [Chania multitudinisentens]|uniref:ChaN family lipoprotein n=1 Tax=Chania multitudinisentens TaxID=1639108 RepID=UPI0003E149FB|nr:ChaN family lipoprotein [Chania multitudinisentens]